MQLLSRRKHRRKGANGIERLFACFQGPHTRKLFRLFRALELRRNAKAWPHTERRTSERDARAKASTVVTTTAC